MQLDLENGWIHLLCMFFYWLVVAITVFLLLSITFYVFFAPFLGKDIYEYVALAVYSILVRIFIAWCKSIYQYVPCWSLLFTSSRVGQCIFTMYFMFQALSVLILYVRCTAIDPADSGILINCDGGSAYKSSKVHISGWLFLILWFFLKPSVYNKYLLVVWKIGDADSLEEPSKIGLKTEENFTKHKSTTCSEIGCFICALMLKEDCWKDEGILQQQASSEEALFCTLCNTEVQNLIS